MEKYKIKKSGIGKKAPVWSLARRVFEHPVFGLSYILDVSITRDPVLGYPVMILEINENFNPCLFLTYIEEDTETWCGKISTLEGVEVKTIESYIYA